MESRITIEEELLRIKASDIPTDTPSFLYFNSLCRLLNCYMLLYLQNLLVHTGNFIHSSHFKYIHKYLHLKSATLKVCNILSGMPPNGRTSPLVAFFFFSVSAPKKMLNSLGIQYQVLLFPSHIHAHKQMPCFLRIPFLCHLIL